MTPMRRLVVVLGLVLAGCPEPRTAPPPPPPPVERPPVTTKPPPPPPPREAPGTRVVVAERASDETWDKMVVAGGRVWVLTNVTRWTNGPMYVPTARLWSAPIAGGPLTHHLDLEGTSALAADDAAVYVAVYRDLAKQAPRSGRVIRLPIAGGAPVDLATGIEPRTIAVDDGAIWTDELRIPRSGGTPAPSGVKGAMAFAFDEDSAYVSTPKTDATGGKILRMPKKGGAPVVLATKLPDEPTGLAVDATHVYLCAVTWSNERAGIVARIPKAGGALEVLAKDQPAPRRVFLDADSVFVLSGRSGRPGSVLRVPKAGGDVTAVASDDTLEQAAMDATSLFVSSAGAFDARTHARTGAASIARIVLR